MRWLGYFLVAALVAGGLHALFERVFHDQGFSLADSAGHGIMFGIVVTAYVFWQERSKRSDSKA